MSDSLEIKGIGDGLEITVPEGDWEQVRPTLLETVEDKAAFLRGAKLVLQIGNRDLGAAELGQLRDILAAREIMLAAVLSSSEHTRSAAADLGLSLDHLRPARVEDDGEAIPTELIGEDAIVLRRTLRSGHSIRHPGHVVVLGDVNPGSEVIAGGSVIVWGRLRGVVHAGATGNDESVVCALELNPTQLRIAGHITVSPKQRRKPLPEMAYVKDDQLIAEKWKFERRR
jgi:septum site-determining protein MinC